MHAPRTGFVHIHGVSVGEILSVVPVIEDILVKLPGVRIVLTSWTKTSQAQAQKIFGNNPRIVVDRLPMDLPWKHGAFYRKYDIRAAIWIDSEIWPGWLFAMKKRGIPAALINGRLSDKSAKRWGSFKPAAKLLLSLFTRIDAQSALDAARFNDLGGNATVQPVNLKYLRPAPSVDATALAALRAHIGDSRPGVVWLSTHDGDEALAMAVHTHLKTIYPSLLTVIVPRHPHRVEDLFVDTGALDLMAARRSADAAHHTHLDILFGDTIGETGLYMALGDIVVMGKSFDPAKPGGQSPIEAAQSGKAIVCGPYMTNFPGVMDDFRAADAIVEVNAGAAANAIDKLLTNPYQAHALGDAARALADAKKAAGPAYIATIIDFLRDAGCA